jgi:hypothetical protein
MPAFEEKRAIIAMGHFAPTIEWPSFIPVEPKRLSTETAVSTLVSQGAWAGGIEADTCRSFETDTVLWLPCSEWLPASETALDQERQSQDSDKAIREFERKYLLDPENALARLRKQIDKWNAAATSGVSPVQAAAVLLSHLPGASYGRQNLLVDTLKRSVVCRDIVRGALSISASPSGPEVLRATAGLLEHYGKDAWPTLQELASNGSPECRYFVWQIAGCDGIAESARIEALARLAQNPDPHTRAEIAEALESGLVIDAEPVWQALAASANLAIHESGAFAQ